MKNREKIIQLLENPLISGDGIEKMSNGRLYSANYQRYKKHVEKEKKPMVIFDTMSAKVEKLLLELAEEVLRVQPKTKQEYKEMVAKYSFRIERFMVVRKKYDHWEIEITTWNKTNVVAYVDCGKLARRELGKYNHFKCSNCKKEYKLSKGICVEISPEKIEIDQYQLTKMLGKFFCFNIYKTIPIVL